MTSDAREEVDGGERKSKWEREMILVKNQNKNMWKREAVKTSWSGLTAW